MTQDTSATLEPLQPSFRPHQDAIDFVNCMAPGERLWWQTYDDKPEKNKTLSHTFAGTLSEAWQRIGALQARGAGVCWTVSATSNGRKKEDFRAARAAWVDIDRPELPEFRVDPTAIVRTGKGHHAYWLIDGECSGEDLEQLNKAIAAAHDGDGKAVDRVRCLRLPGTLHQKGEPVLVRLEACNPDNSYALEELQAAYSPAPVLPSATRLPDAPALAPGETTPYGRRGLEAECAALAMEPEGGRNARAFRAAAAAGQLIAGGELDAGEAREQLLRASEACGLGPREAADVIDRGLATGASQPRRGKRAPASSSARRGRPPGPPKPPDPSRQFLEETEVEGTEGEEPEGEAPRGKLRLLRPPRAPRVNVPMKWSKDAGEWVPAPCAETAAGLLAQDPAAARSVRWDAFQLSAVALERIEGACGLAAVEAGQAVDASTMRAIAAGWTVRYGVRLTKPHLQEALEQLRLDPARRIDPLRDWAVEAGKAWDGKPRLEDAARTYLGAKSLASGLAFKLWLRSAAARAIRGACGPVKADCALVLAGRQGALKSRCIEALSPFPAWFLRGLPDLATRGEEVSRVTRGKAIVEIDELDAFRRADAAKVKAWLSRPVDYQRHMYTEEYFPQPRRFVCCVTINPDAGGWLNDPTGLRRWLIVECDGTLDPEGLERDREQLWGQAIAEVEAGAKWWPTGVDADVLSEAAHGHAVSDAWARLVAEWCHSPERRGTDVQLADVARGALDIDPGRLTMADQFRVSSALRAAGYERVRTLSSSGLRAWLWRATPPPRD